MSDKKETYLLITMTSLVAIPVLFYFIFMFVKFDTLDPCQGLAKVMANKVISKEAFDMEQAVNDDTPIECLKTLIREY